MKHYIVIVASDNNIDNTIVMDTIGVMFMSQRVLQRNFLHLPKRVRYKNEISFLVESKGETTEYQQKRQEDILKEILKVKQVIVIESSDVFGN